MTFWKKLKNWKNYIIGWLHGISREQLRAELLRKDMEREAIVRRFRTVQTEVETKWYGPVNDFETIKRRARKDFAEALGNALLDRAQHFLTDDGRYIVCLTIVENDYGGD